MIVANLHDGGGGLTAKVTLAMGAAALAAAAVVMTNGLSSERMTLRATNSFKLRRIINVTFSTRTSTMRSKSQLLGLMKKAGNFIRWRWKGSGLLGPIGGG